MKCKIKSMSSKKGFEKKQGQNTVKSVMVTVDYHWECFKEVTLRMKGLRWPIVPLFMKKVNTNSDRSHISYTEHTSESRANTDLSPWTHKG